MFNRLFFHWSYNVRKVFYRLLLFQIEYFFVVKTCNMISLPFDIEAYFDFDRALTGSEPIKQDEGPSSLKSLHVIL
jgi:hypothetical protein